MLSFRPLVGFARRAVTFSGQSATANYADFLPHAQAVYERDPVPAARAIIVVIAMLFASILIWSSLALVEQVATAPGIVRPAGKVKQINHPIGGRITAIYVAEGDVVETDDILFELDPAGVREEIDRLSAERDSLAAEHTRLVSELRGTAPQFSSKLAAERLDLTQTHLGLFEARQKSLSARRAAADGVVAQREREAGGLSARLQRLNQSLSILKQQLKAVSELLDKGYFPKLRFLSIKRQVSDLEGEIAETRQSERRALSALTEAKNLRRGVDEDYRSEVLERLSEVKRERSGIESEIAQASMRLGNLRMTAPTAGIVKDVAITSIGQSIGANETALTIVPTGSRLIIDARVSNEDIAQIQVGQRATVKIRAYDFIRFGGLDGVVENIAADATANAESSELAFSVTVRTDRDYLGDREGDQPVIPGMETQVDLHIGKRSILSYLTDRLQHTTHAAFRER